jgi:hypothetical protein
MWLGVGWLGWVGERIETAKRDTTPFNTKRDTTPFNTKRDTTPFNAATQREEKQKRTEVESLHPPTHTNRLPHTPNQ